VAKKVTFRKKKARKKPKGDGTGFPFGANVVRKKRKGGFGGGS
jgi:hypothetical protein